MVNSFVSLFTHFAAASCGKQGFLGLLPWYQYLNFKPDAQGVCTPLNFSFLDSSGFSGILLVLLALIDDLLRIIGFLAVVFVIYAGFKFITSMGSPDEAAKARTTVINALVGLGISMVAVTFVAFLGNQLGGTPSGATSGHLVVGNLPNPGGTDTGSFITTGLSIVFGILGGVAFLVIVIAGFQYTLSRGDPNATAKARSAIIYALVGLVIAIVAESLVSVAVTSRP